MGNCKGGTGFTGSHIIEPQCKIFPDAAGALPAPRNRFNRRSRRGIWKEIFDRQASQTRDSLHLTVSTIVKAPRAISDSKVGGNQAICVSRGGQGTKMRVSLIPGQRFQ
jgi:hypothetical protein